MKNVQLTDDEFEVLVLVLSDAVFTAHEEGMVFSFRQKLENLLEKIEDIKGVS